MYIIEGPIKSNLVGSIEHKWQLIAYGSDIERRIWGHLVRSDRCVTETGRRSARKTLYRRPYLEGKVAVEPNAPILKPMRHYGTSWGSGRSREKGE